jgi:hypothetical protein
MILDRVKIVPWYYGQMQVVATQLIKKSEVVLIEDPLMEVEHNSGIGCILLLEKLLNDKEKLDEFISWNLRKDHVTPFFILKMHNDELRKMVKEYDFNIIDIYILVVINAINFDGKPGLYKIASRINHSCIPNCQQEIDGSRRFTALRNIREGEPITYNYLGEHKSDYFNKRISLYILGFMCKCDVCKNVIIPELEDRIIEVCKTINDLVELDWR